MRNFQWGFGGPGAKPPGNFTVFDHLKHRKRSRRMYENSEKFNSLWEKFFLDFELMGKVFANHPPPPGGYQGPLVGSPNFPISQLFQLIIFP